MAHFPDGNVPAEFGVTFVGGIAEVTAKQVHSPELRVVCVEGCGLHPQRMEVAAHFAMGLGTAGLGDDLHDAAAGDRKSTRLNSSHGYISYAVFCLKKKNTKKSICVMRT